MTQPTSIPSDGNLKVAWVPTLANPAAPTEAELTAASVIDLSCYLTGSGFAPSTEEQTVVDERLCSRQVFEQPGRYSDTLEIGYVYQAQSPLAADNKAFSTLKHLTAGYIVSRWGMAYETAFVAGQIIDVHPVKCGVQRKQAPEGNSIQRIMQKIHITGTVRRDVAVV